MITSKDHRQPEANRQRTSRTGQPPRRRIRPLSRAAVAILAIPIALPLLSACSSSWTKSSPTSASVAVSTTADRSAGNLASGDRATEKVDLRGLQFARDGALRPGSRPVLDAAAELIKNQPDAKVYVDAYDDPSGGPTLNKRLSDKRAAAVRAYLVKDGIAPDRLVARGFGASGFVANNAAPGGPPQNRRIELVIVNG